MNTAIARLNPDTKRWEAHYQGNLIAASRSPVYVGNMIRSGLCAKAKKFNVTDVTGLPSDLGLLPSNTEGAEDGEAAPTHTVEKEFPINERFEIMTSYTDMVARGQIPSVLVTGGGGLGKSFTVMQALKAAGLQDISKMDIGAKFDGQQGYTVVKGYSTAKGLFRTLYENRKQIVVFDDCDSILKDGNAVNTLKAALDSYDERWITWNAEGWGSEDELPKTFLFEGGVIFISNMQKHKVPQAIRSRAMNADVSMTRREVIERMRMIVTSEHFMPNFEEEHKQEAMEYVAEQEGNNLVVELNLRSLVNAVKARTAQPDRWKRLALYDMVNSSN